MSIVDRLLGRPTPDQVLQLLEQASASIPDEPLEALTHLERLGPRPWRQSGNEPALELGFALRAHASWLLGEEENAAADVRSLVAVRAGADALLPIVPILIDGMTELVEAPGRALANRWGSCRGVACGHTPRVEAALAILRNAQDGSSIVRWGGVVPFTDQGASVRIAAYLRAKEVGPPDGAVSLLSGDHPRLLNARAYLAYSLGRFDVVMSMLPAGSELAGRAALAQTVRGGQVPVSVRGAADAYADINPAARAMLAEHDGRWSDAAAAWRGAGQADKALRASVLADPKSAFDPALIQPSVRWYAHAAGSAARPSTVPVNADELTNARVGAARERIRAILSGSSLPSGASDHAAVRDIERILDRIADDPSIASTVLSAADPAISPVPQLADMLAAPPRPAHQPSDAWREWTETHPERQPVPRPVAPLQWLVDPAAGSVPNLRGFERLRPEERLPILATLVQMGAPRALAAAAKLLEPEQLATVASSALPELALLGSALSGRRQVDPGTRRRAAIVASASLANRVARGAARNGAAAEATRLVSSGISDLHPDPATLTPEEAFRIESETLAAFATTSRRRAVGPVLHLLSGLSSPVVPPDDALPLYDDDTAIVVMLLRVGRADEARAAFIKGSMDDSYLAADIGAAIAERHLAAGRPYAALHELASLPDPDGLLAVDGDPLERVAVAVVRDGAGDGLDQAIADAERLLADFDYFSEVETMAVELYLRRARLRPGSPVLDLPDLERAFEIDATHPRVPRQLAYALVTRAMEEVERDPAAAVKDVDRATDIFMGDHDMAILASRVATHAGVVFFKKRRDRKSALGALNVALAIDPNNQDALAGQYMMMSGR